MHAIYGGEGQVGESKVGAVEDDDAVVVEELHVHGDNADVFVEELPLSLGGGFRRVKVEDRNNNNNNQEEEEW